MSVEDLASLFLELSLRLSLVLLGAAFLMTVLRIWKGPTLADRVLGLDVLTSIAIGFIAVVAIDTGFTLYVDIAIALGLVGFLATVAFARFILTQGEAEEHRGDALPLAGDLPGSDGPFEENEAR
ncbi:cation:proton antiporter [Mangrovibrevibacter kandeliae]|uniref:cation:proton antiporter n=1 Tax=Mangrovibrevibacter kandeliae TaxID=2968473 RepID=UPI002742484D|nr:MULTISPECIES: cation:proton antiporter [unclassified Aurantimonas]